MTKTFLCVFAFMVFFVGSLEARGTIEDGLCKLYTTEDLNVLTVLESSRNLKRHGVVIEYYENGDIKKLFWYRNNKPDGTAKFYAKGGRLLKEVTYMLGRVMNIKEYNEAGEEMVNKSF